MLKKRLLAVFVLLAGLLVAYFVYATQVKNPDSKYSFELGLDLSGGTQLILRVDGMDVPQQVLIDDPQAAQWQPGQRLLLHWARGGRSGHFVTGWLVLEPPVSAPSVQAGVLQEQ